MYLIRAMNVSLTSVGCCGNDQYASTSNEMTDFFSDFEISPKKTQQLATQKKVWTVCVCASSRVCTVCEQACICNFGYQKR